MKALLASLVLLASGSAFAHNTWTMACSDVRDLVDYHGAIVLHTSPTTYDRYVSAAYQCEQGLWQKPAWVHTADMDNCFVGYTCVPNNENGGGAY